ncbi:MAG: AraC family transcriptional regulator [Spirochaetaceae bacterium]|jgi:AraC-like DNA-binding protein|nr:AraC family transcriptional regulator [Spirochaetaceae bacterium]
MFKLLVRDDMSEDVPYTSSHLPVYSVLWKLSSFLNYRADCHWHPDLEFTVVLEGEMTYQVNGCLYQLHRGDGIFVNANRFHFGAGALEHGDIPECIFHCLRFNPSLLCAHPYIEARFINPLLYDSRFDALVFPAPGSGMDAGDGRESEWKAQALERITAIMELTIKVPDDSALETQCRLYDLWALLFANTINRAKDEKITVNREDLTIKRILSFIQKNFSEKITLDDIAEAGMVCRSKCCRVFKQALRISVFDYLLNFRIRQSLAPLRNESMSISEIALASGFSTVSYYGEIFKRLLGMSPGEYRRKFRAGEPLPQV